MYLYAVPLSYIFDRHLSNDPDCRHLMPLDVDGKDLYAKITDGILVWYVEGLHLYSTSASFPANTCCVALTFLSFLPFLSGCSSGGVEGDHCL